jgi:anti-sigma factor RsiW
MDAELKGSACRDYQTLLEDYLSGELEGSAAERFLAHLVRCTSCREAFEMVRLSSRIVRAAREPQADPGPGFTRRVMAAIRDEGARRFAGGAFWRPLETLAWRLAVTATLVLAFLLGYGLRTSFVPAQPVPQQVALQPEVRDIFSEPVQQPASRDEILISMAERNHGR